MSLKPIQYFLLSLPIFIKECKILVTQTYPILLRKREPVPFLKREAGGEFRDPRSLTPLSLGEGLGVRPNTLQHH